jgi:hypothetical protein
LLDCCRAKIVRAVTADREVIATGETLLYGIECGG